MKMGYDPAHRSLSDEEGEVPESPGEDERRCVVFTHNGEEFCLIEWKQEDDTMWVLARDDGSFVDIEEAI